MVLLVAGLGPTGNGVYLAYSEKPAILSRLSSLGLADGYSSGGRVWRKCESCPRICSCGGTFLPSTLGQITKGSRHSRCARSHVCDRVCAKLSGSRCSDLPFCLQPLGAAQGIELSVDDQRDLPHCYLSYSVGRPGWSWRAALVPARARIRTTRNPGCILFHAGCVRRSSGLH